MPRTHVQVLVNVSTYAVNDAGEADELIGKSAMSETIEVEFPRIDSDSYPLQMGAIRLAADSAIREKLAELRELPPEAAPEPEAPAEDPPPPPAPETPEGE